MPRSLSLVLAMLLSLGVAMVAATQAFGQDPPSVAMGMSPQATYHSGDFDFVDMSTGRLNLHIPLVADHSQRGNLNFTYSLTYTSTGAWNQVSKPPHGFFFIEPPKYGVSSPAIVNDSALSGMTSQVYHDQSNGYFAEAWSVFEGGWGIGRQHPLGTTPGGFKSIDGSGISASIYLNCQGDAYVSTNRKGIQFLDNTSGTCTLPHTAWIEDANGNQTALGADNSFPTSTT
jgi:hypothetical protein